MKRTLIFVAAALLLASCGGKTPSPVEAALNAAIAENLGQELKSVTYASLEKVDSTTFGQELEKRRAVLAQKAKSEEELYMKYMSEGKRTNATMKLEAVTKAKASLARLDSLAGTIADRLDEVAYYDYTFTAAAKGVEKDVAFKDAWALITPDLEVLGMATSQKSVHKGSGKVIPGYVEMLKGAAE